MPFDDLSGGFFVFSFPAKLQELCGQRVDGATILALKKARVVGTKRPKELMETLWVVKNKDALRAWAAQVRLGAKPLEAAEGLLRNGSDEADEHRG